VYILQVVVLENQSLWLKDKPLCIAYRSLFSNYMLLWINASCCVQFISRYTCRYGQKTGAFYRSLCSNYRLLWTESKLLCTIHKSLYWNYMSLWAKDKTLSIAYRSFCLHLKSLWIKYTVNNELQYGYNNLRSIKNGMKSAGNDFLLHITTY